MNFIPRSIRSFISAQASARVNLPDDIDAVRKVLLVNSMAFLGVAFLVPFGIEAWAQGAIVLGITDFAAVVVLAGAWAYGRRRGNYGFSVLVCLIVMALLFLFLVATGGPSNTGPLWSYCLPLVPLYLLGLGWGSLFFFVYFAAACLLLFVPGNPLLTATYPLDMKIRYPASLLCVAAFAYIYELVMARLNARIVRSNTALQKNVAEHRETERALQLSEQRFRDITLSTSDIIWEVDTEGTLTYLGGRVEESLGFTDAELLGKHIFDLTIEEQRQELREHFLESVRQKARFDIPECWVLNKDHLRVCLEFNGKPTLDAAEGLLGFRGMAKDRTSQKRAEEDRARIEENLRTAQKMEAVGQLAGGIAHDFNNILGSISGYAEMISKRVGDSEPKIRKYADTILSASSRAADLTSKLLAFARRGRFQNVLFNMHHSIRELIDLLRLTIDKRITIILNPSAINPMVHGDPTQMSNALLNLALNSRDAMPGAGKLVFETSNLAVDEVFKVAHNYDIMPGDYLCIAVSDTGSGMDDKTKARVFEPFFTTKDVGKGTGLGLASVYGTIKTHKGYITVYSEVGLGTTIKIYLPSARPRPDAPGQGQPQVDELVYGRGNIMVIDDEKFLLELSREVLEKLGYTPTIFEAASDALAYYAQNYRQIDLVIVDMIMPGTNGRDCLRRIKEINPEAKVILSTGYSLDADASDLMREGFIGVLQKPFVMGTLSRAVAKAMGVIEGGV
jgi:two-component system, cell cycle sensor histidine kinase and response regulator CckA